MSSQPPPAPPQSPPPAEPPKPLPPPNPELLRWASVWTGAALLWTTLTAVVVVNTPALFRWLLFSKHSRYVVVAGLLLMMLWPEARRHVGERSARAYLAVVATFYGLLGALLAFALKLTPFLTVLALASFSFGAMVVVGSLVPVSLRKPRQALEVVRRLAELTLAGVTLGPQLGWLETAFVVLGLAATLLIVGDDVQTMGDDSRVVEARDMQRVATVRAVDLYISYFRLTLLFTELLRRRRKK